MLAFGLRRGEALGLHWSALDWDAATLKVTHAVKRIRDRTETSELRTRLVIGELKTARSRRTLFLTPELVELLRRHRARLAEERIAIGPALAGTRLDLSKRLGDATGPGQRVALVLQDLPAGRPRPLAPARAASLRGVVDAGSGHRPLRGLRSSRTLERRNHERRVRAPRRRTETRSCRSYVRGAAAVQWLPQWLPEPTRTRRRCWLNAKKRFLTR
jgi:integrase